MAAATNNTSNTEVMHSVGKRRYTISGTFSPNGNGAIDATKNAGTAGWTVARTGVGQYTITLDRQWKYLCSKGCSAAFSALTVSNLQWGAIDLTAGTLVLNNVNATAVATEIAANAANTISFHLVVSNDTVTG